jgi:two-component system sensor histidine kinase BarA|tara:strand:+ start:8617 stop:10866 length:2250 start_codon:yes stop_codon:yes gene_type:complete
MRLKSDFNSIHARLLITGLIPLALLGIVLGWYMISSQSKELVSNMHDTGRIATNQMASNAEFALYSGNQEILETLGYSILDIPSVSGILFYNSVDNTTVRIGDIDFSTKRMPESFDSGLPFFINDHWYFYSRITLQQGPMGDYDELGESIVEELGWVLVSLTNEILLYKQRRVIFGALIVITLGLLVAAWVSMRIGRSISRPLEGLTEVVDLMEAGGLESLASEEGPIELRKLAYGINQLATSVHQSNVRMQSEIARATAQLQITLIELEDAMEAQDQFLARMSHELRTPLTAVIGFSKLLSIEVDGSKRDEHLRVIERSSTMLLTMIDDILEFSKAHLSGFSLEEINFDIHQWVSDAMAIHQQRADEKNLQFTYDLADDVPRQLCGDPVRLTQVLANLLNNAIKFTDKGFVALSIRCKSNEDGMAVLECSVSDSGKGIAEEKIPFLFEPFSQEDTSINRRFGGTGLGLSICKRLAQAMGGDVKIESVVNKGSTISFTCVLSTVDIEDSSAIVTNGMNPTEQLLEGLIILVAEDNPFNQKLVVRLMEGYGATCMVANNGLEAIELAGELHADVVLMDLHMPVVDGVVACERIMQQSGESPPIIGLTADITQAEHQRMLSAGAVSIQSKPLNEIALVNAILSSLSDQRKLSESSDGGLLASVIPAEELKTALFDDLSKLETHLSGDEKMSLRQIIHDLMGLCGLYGMSELRELVLEFRATYGTLDVAENLEKVRKIRQHIDDFFDAKSAD